MACSKPVDTRSSAGPGKYFRPDSARGITSIFASNAAKDAAEYQDRIERLEDPAVASGNEESLTELDVIRRDLAALNAKVKRDGHQIEDPDEARRIVAEAKAVRGRLSHLEHLQSGRDATQAPLRFAGLIEATEVVVRDFGSTVEQQQLNVLKRQLERAVERADTREHSELSRRSATSVGAFLANKIGSGVRSSRAKPNPECHSRIPRRPPD